MEGDSELKSLIKVWLTVFASLTLCHLLVRKIPQGILRLLSLLPIIALFTLLPLNLSSIHLTGITSFFITWLCNFKLLLFAFNQGPLSLDPSISLLHFICISCLPIQIKPQQNPSHQTTQNGLKSPLNYSIKALLLALVIKSYDYKPFLHQNFILTLYCFHIYLAVEIVLAVSAVPARAILGFEIEPQFNDPYLSTSLQDFWGKRWNLIVTRILRPTVYHPIRSICTPIFGKRWALVMGLCSTFLVSGLMHELIYFYMTRVRPTWEVTWFFVLHGVCTSVEILGKNALGDRWRLHPMIGVILTIGFVAITGFWLFFVQLVRYQVDVRAIGEYSLLVEFVKVVLLSRMR